MALYLARFLRPKHLWWLLTADLPKFKRVGGSVTVLGQELAANATLDTARAQESNALDRRVARLEEQVRKLIGVDETLLDSVTTVEVADVERTTKGERATHGTSSGAG